MSITNRFYEREWREAMDRLSEHIALLEKLMAEHKPGDSEEALLAAGRKLVELARAFPDPRQRQSDDV